jgi:hypothetical protein
MARPTAIAAATGRRCQFVAQVKATISSHGARGGHGGPEDQSGSPPHRGPRSVPQPASPVHRRTRRNSRGPDRSTGGRRGLFEATSPVRFKPPSSSASLRTTAPARHHAPSTKVQISALIRARPHPPRERRNWCVAFAATSCFRGLRPPRIGRPKAHRAADRWASAQTTFSATTLTDAASQGQAGDVRRGAANRRGAERPRSDHRSSAPLPSKWPLSGRRRDRSGGAQASAGRGHGRAGKRRG